MEATTTISNCRFCSCDEKLHGAPLSPTLFLNPEGLACGRRHAARAFSTDAARGGCMDATPHFYAPLIGGRSSSLFLQLLDFTTFFRSTSAYLVCLLSNHSAITRNGPSLNFSWVINVRTPVQAAVFSRQGGIHSGCSWWTLPVGVATGRFHARCTRRLNI